MDTHIIRRIKAQLAVATNTIQNIHNEVNGEQMLLEMPVEISLRDLIALLGVSDSALQFLLEHEKAPKHQEHLEMLDRTLTIVGNTLLKNYPEITMTTAKGMLSSASVTDLMSKRQTH